MGPHNLPGPVLLGSDTDSLTEQAGPTAGRLRKSAAAIAMVGVRLTLAAMHGGARLFTTGPHAHVVGEPADRITLAAATLRQGYLINTASQKCLDIFNPGNDHATSSGTTKVNIYTCHGGDNQQWYLKADGTLVNPASQKCLDIYNPGGARSTLTNNKRVQVHKCHGGANQKWVLRDDGTMINPASKKCLDIYNPGGARATLTDEKQVQLHTCHGGGNQKWKIADSISS